MSDSHLDRPCIVATCVCGGWVMVSAQEPAHKETWEEVAYLTEKGFTIRTNVPKREFLEMEMCEEQGACTEPGPRQEDMELQTTTPPEG